MRRIALTSMMAATKRMRRPQSGHSRTTIWPSPRFVDNQDGTISDERTGLMWSSDGD